MNIPTDLKILNAIYNSYYSTFESFDKDKPTRSNKVYVPIDVDKIGKELSVDGDIIFGRLYYHLNNKFAYEDEKGKVHFFAIKIGSDKHCIQFPYMASILADLRRENRKYRTATTIAVISLMISIVSFTMAFFK